MIRLSVSLIGALLLVTSSCSDATSASSAGTTSTLLTDAPFPFDRVARVDLYVVSVSASLSPDTSSTQGGSFFTLATPNRRINVLALQGGITDELGKSSLPTGAITAVRMVIDTDSSSITLKNGLVLTGRSTPGIQWQSSAGRPTLNALIHEQIRVPNAGAVVVVDFDVGKAFITPQELNPASTDSGFIFSPVIHAADATRTGSIAGVVRAHTGTGSPVADASLRLYLGKPSQPENTWSTLSTTKTDATGAFKFSYVTRSAFWSETPTLAGYTYIVAVDPPATAGLGRMVVTNVSVSAGAQTTVGTVILP
ncbi:MAG TPA: DUF4382 domain-containing protein [Gemmatimonadaceae bacterium]